MNKKDIQLLSEAYFKHEKLSLEEHIKGLSKWIDDAYKAIQHGNKELAISILNNVRNVLDRI